MSDIIKINNIGSYNQEIINNTLILQPTNSSTLPPSNENDWYIFSYLGLFFAIIYRIPQIIKIYKTRKADDLSGYSYLTHNGAYISFILYLVGSGKTNQEWVLCFYYFMGISQNLLIYLMKLYYANNRPNDVLPT